MINPLKCPKCRTLPLALLQKDYTLKLICDCGYKGQCSLTDLFNNKLISSEQKIFQCEYKNHSEKGIKFCLKCQIWLCQKCLKEHNECNEKHQLIDIDLKLNCKCTYHKYREVKYFCNKCQIKICELCKKGLYATQGNYDINNKEECYHNFVSLSSLISKQQHLNICSLYIEVDSQKENSNENETNNYLMKLLKLFLSLYDMANKTNNYSIIFNLLDNFDIFAMNNVNHKTIAKYIKTNHTSKLRSKFTLFQENINLPEIKRELYCMRLLKDGRLAFSMNEGIIDIYSLPSFEEDTHIKEQNYIPMYYLHELDSGVLLCGSDSSIFCYEPQGKDFKRIKEIKISIGESISQIISLNNELLASISNKVLRIFNNEFPFALSHIKQFNTEDDKKNLEMNIVYKVKEDLVLLGFKDNKHIVLYNYKTKTTEKTIEGIGTYSNDCIREFFDYLIIGGNKQISVVDKNKFEVVVNYENIICDVYYMVNVGINELLIGGDHYFYSFDVLNYKLTRLIEYNEITNKTYSEIGNNKIIVFTKSDFQLKLYKYITEEIE